MKPLLSAFVFLFLSCGNLSAENIAALHLEAETLYKTRDQRGHAAQAIKLYKHILAQNPTDVTALWKLSRSYLWQGDHLSSDKKQRFRAYKIAEDYALQSISAKPDNVGGHLMLGIAYGRMAEMQGIWKSLFLISPIKKQMETVLKLDPDNDVAFHVLGVLYQKLPKWMAGSTDKSLHLLQNAIQKNPNRTVHYLAIADTYLKQKKQAKAIASLKKLFDIKHPEDPVQTQIDKSIADAMLRKLTLIYTP